MVGVVVVVLVLVVALITGAPNPYYYSKCSAVEHTFMFLLSPILGKISDCYGRKPVLLWSFTVHAAALLCMAIKPGE